MSEPRHIIIKPTHTAIISIGFISMLAGACLYLGSLKKTIDIVEGAMEKNNEQHVVINNKINSIDKNVGIIANQLKIDLGYCEGCINLAMSCNNCEK